MLGEKKKKKEKSKSLAPSNFSFRAQFLFQTRKDA